MENKGVVAIVLVVITIGMGVAGFVFINLPADDITTTTTTSSETCISEEIYGKYSEQTERMRYFRDEVLNQTPEGQEVIRLYYEWSPVVVKAMGEDEKFRNDMKEMIDAVLPLIRTETE